jgi:hypothetical protein
LDAACAGASTSSQTFVAAIPSTRADSSIRDRTWNAFRNVDEDRPASATAFVMIRTSEGLRNATFFAPMVGTIQFRVSDS